MRQRAAVIITKKGKLLLMHRIKDGHEYYCIPGGGVERGETVEEAAIREIREETGLEVALGELFMKTERQGIEEYFFIARSAVGMAELGGPERERNCERNHYDLQWIECREISDITLYPQDVQRELMHAGESIFLSV